jgi:hypothetical protein
MQHASAPRAEREAACRRVAVAVRPSTSTSGVSASLKDTNSGISEVTADLGSLNRF